MLDGRATTGPVRDVDDAGGMARRGASAAHRRHTARLEAAGEVVVGVKRQEQHAVGVLARYAATRSRSRDVAVIVSRSLVRRLREPLADAAEYRGEVGVLEQPVAGSDTTSATVSVRRVTSERAARLGT